MTVQEAQFAMRIRVKHKHSVRNRLTWMVTEIHPHYVVVKSGKIKRVIDSKDIQKYEPLELVAEH